MKALISPNEGYRVVEVTDKEFDVVAPLYWVDCEDNISAEYIHYNNTFINPNELTPRAPETVSMRQARLALHRLNLLDDVSNLILSLPEPQKTEAKIDWEYSQEVNRNYTIVKTIANGLKLTEQELDDLFLLASSL